MAERRRPSLALSLGAGSLACIMVMALLSLAWTPHDPIAIQVSERLQPASASNLLGTDALGRDILSLLMAGAWPSLLAGVIAVSIGLGIGGLLGLAAAMGGRHLWADSVMRGADLLFAFPAILSAALLTAAFGPGLATAIAAIGIYNIPVFARLTEAQSRAVLTRDFVRAAAALGVRPWRIARDHVLPNVAPLLFVQAGTQFAIAVLAEAALSYLGFGVQPPTPSWGRMLNDAQALLYTHPWIAVWPGAMIALTVLSLNLLSDGLRDLLDPRLSYEHKDAL